MVLITLPIIKLSFLGIQQLSRPVIKLIRLEAKQSKTFRNYICVPAAQCYHWCEVRLKMLLLNLGRPAKVEPLNEAMAVELGTEVLGELIVFFVAATGVIIETRRQANKRNLVAKSINVHHKEIIEALKVLEYRQERQKVYLQELTRVLTELGEIISMVPCNHHTTQNSKIKPY
ncbi:PREDICTED: putative OPA3-like protein CG13603 [Rhagoletis zephyria]|uniref:putative OPA3-like protein CG13603 n=1 Tax=Rhagoletis zephyria TaxID=28612 RepID=UPI0008115A49|nr:PREDICTED: putative OPA3-like protein CG13603 [Rhagoletis zephyria]